MCLLCTSCESTEVATNYQYFIEHDSLHLLLPRLELQTQLTNAAAQVSEADSQTEFLRSQLEGSLASLQKLEDELNARNSQLQESSSQVVGLQEDLQRLMQEREGAVQLQTHFDEATTTIEELNQALFEKNSAVQMQSEQIVALERRLEELSIVESQLRCARLASILKCYQLSA